MHDMKRLPFEDPFGGRAQAALEAVAGHISFFKKHHGHVESRWKQDNTRVTQADIGISRGIFEALQKDFPQDNYCSEETSPEAGEQPLNAEYAWVLDPVDGTNNYALGFPNCCISLALLRAGMPVCGFVYDFSRDELVCGGAGVGLFANGRPKKGKDAALIPQSLMGIQFPLKPELVEKLKPFLSVYRLRSIGSSALNLTHTAAGLLDGAFGRAYVWDFAAGLALIQGGGGNVYFDGNNPFPLKTFHTKLPAFVYYGGSPQFCEAVQTLGLGATKL